MIVDVFDDKKSLIHLICGLLTPFFKWILPVFLFYELIEFMLRKDERLRHFLGDLTEYFYGLALHTLIAATL